MTALWLIGFLLLGAAAPPTPGVDVEAYRRAAGAGQVGTVKGRAYEERRKPDGPDQPLAGTSLTLLPRSPVVVAELERVKQHSRDSAGTYRAAVPAIRALRETYERTLWELGAPELVLSAVAGPDGAFAFDQVPAGAWILVGFHAVAVEKSGRPSPGSKEKPKFAPRSRLVGYDNVDVWLVELSVAGGRVEAVELTDRNVWLAGVVEERTLDAGR